MIRFVMAATVVLGLAAPLAAADGGYWQPGGFEGRIGSPYYYSVPVVPSAAAPWGPTVYPAAPVHHGEGCHCLEAGRGYSDGSAAETVPTVAPGEAAGWWSGGFAYAAGDPYTYHFGPGDYRWAEHGHFRFPYYSYRRPWYYPGQPVFHRDTNFAW